MAPEGSCVILFASIHDVIAAEKALGRLAVPCDLVPVPREISPDCGMALLCSEADLSRAAEALAASPAKPAAAYRSRGGAYEPISTMRDDR